MSSLGLLEIQSTFAMKVRSGVLDRTAAATQRARLMLDIASGDVEVLQPDRGSLHRRGAPRRTAWIHTSFADTLDALQLAVALDLSSQRLVISLAQAHARSSPPRIFSCGSSLRSI